MAPLPDRRLLLGLLFLVVVVGALGFLLGRALAPRAPEPRDSPVQDGGAVDVTTRRIRLFFAVPNADRLQEEERTIPRAASLVEEAKRAVAELIKGAQTDPNPPVPAAAGLGPLDDVVRVRTRAQ